MKKYLLIASLAVISMNVLGMNPLEDNNQNGSNPGHLLTPNSGPNRNSNSIESIQESVFKFFQGDLSENEAKKLVNTMFSLIISQETTQLRELEQLEKQQRDNQLIAEKDAIISELNNGITQFQSVNRQLASSNENLLRKNAQLKFENRTLNQNVVNLRLLSRQLWFTNQNLRHNLNSTQRIIRNGAYQVLREGSMHITQSALLDFAIHLHDRSNQTNVTISELSEDNTMEHVIGLRSSSKRLVPRDYFVSQPPAQRRRIDPEAATSSTSHLQQPVEIRDENAANLQNDAEQIDQNLVDRITLNFRKGAHTEESIELFRYLTDPNYAGSIHDAYLSLATTALNIWNVITDNEREYLSILARNIHNSPNEFSDQDRTRINELESAIKADRNISPNENFKITVNTGSNIRDLIEIINDVRDRENDLQAAMSYSGSEKTNPLIAILAQTNWPAQPCIATDAELNNFEQSVQAFVDQYNQRKVELENSNNPDKDKLLKTNIVDTVLNLRKFGLGDHVIVNRLNLFNSKFNNDLTAYRRLKSLYPCLQKGFPFNKARQKAVAALKRQGVSLQRMLQFFGMTPSNLSFILQKINYTMEHVIGLRSYSQRPVPEDDSVSQPPAQRRRIDPEAATSSTSHLQQPAEILDENAANLQNDAEQTDQNLADHITLNYWGGTSLNPDKCIELFRYLTDPNYAGSIYDTYLSLATAALNMWNVITDNEREYLSILARNIHNSPNEFSDQDRTRINELESAIKADRNISPNENFKITVNTGSNIRDLIEIINDVRDRENDLQATMSYSGTEKINPLIAILAQTNWPAQPCIATDAELNNFEQSVQAFVDQYNQRKAELENSNNPDKDKLLKTNIVDTVLNLRKFGLGDHIIVNRLNLFNSKFNNDLMAYRSLKSLYPCLQKGFPFYTARKKIATALNRQGVSLQRIAQFFGVNRDYIYRFRDIRQKEQKK